MELVAAEFFYEARKLPDGSFAVVEQPSMHEEVKFPATEWGCTAAKAHALSLNRWLDSRPDPVHVNPFFDESLPDILRAAPERLMMVIERTWEFEKPVVIAGTEYA